MAPSPETVPGLRAMLSALRQARFGEDLCCPHCGAVTVQPWGSFSERRRYRCRKCRRTFSELTNTAAAHCKRLHLWPRYLASMRESQTIRGSALLLGVAPSSTFRWRHRILGAIGQADASELGGLIELDTTRLRYSEKGQRPQGRAARTRGFRAFDPRAHLVREIGVLVGCDRSDGVVSAVLQTALVYDHDVQQHIMPRVRGVATILAAARENSAYGRVARANGHEYVEVARFGVLKPGEGETGLASGGETVLGSAPAHHLDTVLGYIASFRHWLLRFCGVATKYLHHYLYWHQTLRAHVGWAFLAQRAIARRRSAPPARRAPPTDTATT